MPTYSFQMSAGLAGSSVSVTAVGSSTVVASGTLDTNALFTASLPVGDYVAKAADGHYSYSSAGTVVQPDPDQLADLNSTFGRPRRNTVVLLGDSITAQNAAPSPHVGNAAAGYWTQASVRLGHRLKLLYNAGISGNTFAQMRARMQADVIARAPGWCVVEGGPNDKDRTPAAIIADLTAIYTGLLDAGIRVVACTMTPTTAITTTTQKQTYASVNRWINSYVRTQRDMVLCDWASALSDPATGNPITNACPDGTHPSPFGAAIMGKILADALANIVPDTKGLWLPQSNADPYNLVTNGMGVGTTGTLNAPGGTGSTRTSWTIYNNGGTNAYTAAKVARTDLPGCEWSQVQATTGNADTLKLQAASITTGWAIGDRVLVTVEYETDEDFVGLVDFALYVNLSGGPGVASDLYRSSGEQPVTRQPGKSGVLRVEFTVPAGMTNAQVQALFKATTGTVRWGRCGVYNLTALGLTS